MDDSPVKLQGERVMTSLLHCHHTRTHKDSHNDHKQQHHNKDEPIVGKELGSTICKSVRGEGQLLQCTIMLYNTEGGGGQTS